MESARELMDWVKRGVVAFYVSPVTDSGEVWFVITLVAPKLPFDVVRLTALKLLLVLEDTGLDGLLVFDGDGGVGLLWTYGVVDPDDLPGDLWSFQHGVAAALQVRLEKRLAGTPERVRVGRWLGYEGPVTRMEGAGRGDRVIITTGAMAPDGLVRVPFSLHEDTGLAAVPVTREDLYRFKRDRHGAPARARRLRRHFEVPLNFPRAVAEALQL